MNYLGVSGLTTAGKPAILLNKLSEYRHKAAQNKGIY